MLRNFAKQFIYYYDFTCIKSVKSVQQVGGVDSELTVMINTTNETLTLHLKMNE